MTEQLDLFGRTKPNARAEVIDWDAVSGMDLVNDERVLARYIREELPRSQAQDRRFAQVIKERNRTTRRLRYQGIPDEERESQGGGLPSVRGGDEHPRRDASRAHSI